MIISTRAMIVERKKSLPQFRNGLASESADILKFFLSVSGTQTVLDNQARFLATFPLAGKKKEAKEVFERIQK